MSSLPALDSITNGTAVDATEVDGNFTTLATFVDGELINRDGSVAMTSELTLSSSTPSGALVAASKGYVDSVSTDANTAVFTRTTNISASASASGTVTFETESNDLDGWWSTGTTFTCPLNGVFAISIRFEKSSGSGTIQGFIAVGATTSIAIGPVSVGSGTTAKGVAGGTVYLKSGETFTITYNETSGTNSATITNVYLTITKIAEL